MLIRFRNCGLVFEALVFSTREKIQVEQTHLPTELAPLPPIFFPIFKKEMLEGGGSGP